MRGVTINSFSFKIILTIIALSTSAASHAQSCSNDVQALIQDKVLEEQAFPRKDFLPFYQKLERILNYNLKDLDISYKTPESCLEKNSSESECDYFLSSFLLNQGGALESFKGQKIFIDYKFVFKRHDDFELKVVDIFSPKSSQILDKEIYVKIEMKNPGFFVDKFSIKALNEKEDKSGKVAIRELLNLKESHIDKSSFKINSTIDFTIRILARPISQDKSKRQLLLTYAGLSDALEKALNSQGKTMLKVESKIDFENSDSRFINLASILFKDHYNTELCQEDSCQNPKFRILDHLSSFVVRLVFFADDLKSYIDNLSDDEYKAEATQETPYFISLDKESPSRINFNFMPCESNIAKEDLK